MHMKSYLLVFIQFSCLLYFLFFGADVANSLILGSMTGLGIVVGVWAIVAMKPIQVSVFPEPRPSGKLVQSGPYRWIRHPMYTSILLVCLSFALAGNTPLGYGVFLVLLINQWVKLTYEETLLMKQYSNYQEYMKRSKRLIPFLF